MKSVLVALFFLGIAQASSAETHCSNTDFNVSLKLYNTQDSCSFDVAGPDIKLAYLGRKTLIQNGFECAGIAFTAGPYRSSTFAIQGSIGTLTFASRSVSRLVCD